jgi:hypothetical protein
MVPLFVTTIALRRHMYFSRWLLVPIKKQGRPWTAPLVADTTGLRCGASCYLVKSGADHLKRPDVRSPLEHLAQ